MKSGSRKGQSCGERSTIESRVYINYCFTHAEKHKEEWEPIVKRIVKEREIQEKNKREEKQKKIDSLPKDQLNAQKIFEALRTFKKDSPNSITDFLLKPVEKTEDTIEKAVEKILQQVIVNLISNPAFGSAGMQDIVVYPCSYRGWGREEVMNELEKRLYKVYPHDEYCLFLRPDIVL